MAWYGKQFVSPAVLAQYQTDGEGDFESLANCPEFDAPQYCVPGQRPPTLEEVVVDQLTLVSPDINFWYIISNGRVVAEGQARAMLAYLSEFVEKLEDANGIQWCCPENSFEPASSSATADHEVVWFDKFPPA